MIQNRIKAADRSSAQGEAPALRRWQGGRSLKQLALLVPLVLAACTTPVAPPLASTGMGASPPAGSTVPPGHCCSSPTRVSRAGPQRQAPSESQRPSTAPESPQLPPASASELALAKSNRAFAVSLYRQLAAKPGNLFTSPISIAGAFGPVAAGARGQTRAEIGKVLHFPADDEVLNRSVGSILRTLETLGDGPRVSIANALWLSKHASIEPDFVGMARRSYDAEVDTLDFNDSPTAAARINNWVDRETNSRIPQLFKPDVQPTHEQLLKRSLSGATDILYGVIVEGAAPGQPARFRIVHVYRGSRRKGDTIEAPVGWGHPTPVCAGMMGAAPARPPGAYGVIAFARHAPHLDFIQADDVQLMIRRGWIKSARSL
jgi:hypothetical protein